MRLPVSTLEVFNAIARAGSLNGAASALGVTPSTVSHQLKALEAWMGTALFVRTTRQIALTDAGRALVRGTEPAFGQLEEAVRSAQDLGAGPRGELRITMPTFAYDLVVGPRLADFRMRHPDIAIEISLDESLDDLRGRSFHAGFRLGGRIDDDMVAVRLAPAQRIAVLASEAYLAKHGVPETPADLLQHECIRYRFKTSDQLAPWVFEGPDGEYRVDVAGHLIVNSLDVLYEQVGAGLGLGYSFAHYAPNGLEGAPLIPLFADVAKPVPALFAYFPREYRNLGILRTFIDHMRDDGGRIE